MEWNSIIMGVIDKNRQHIVVTWKLCYAVSYATILHLKKELSFTFLDPGKQFPGKLFCSQFKKAAAFLDELKIQKRT